MDTSWIPHDVCFFCCSLTALTAACLGKGKEDKGRTANIWCHSAPFVFIMDVYHFIWIHLVGCQLWFRLSSYVQDDKEKKSKSTEAEDEA